MISQPRGFYASPEPLLSSQFRRASRPEVITVTLSRSVGRKFRPDYELGNHSIICGKDWTASGLDNDVSILRAREGSIHWVSWSCEDLRRCLRGQRGGREKRLWIPQKACWLWGLLQFLKGKVSRGHWQWAHENSVKKKRIPPWKQGHLKCQGQDMATQEGTQLERTWENQSLGTEGRGRKAKGQYKIHKECREKLTRVTAGLPECGPGDAFKKVMRLCFSGKQGR